MAHPKHRISKQRSIILYVRNAGITGVNWLLRKLLLHNIDAMIKIALDNTAPCTRGL